MKKQFVAATVLALSAMTGVAQADLATDLTRMPAAEALAKAAQSQQVSVEALISDAAIQLQESPKLLSALISAALAAYPEQAAQIVYAAVSAVPSLKATIVKTAGDQLADNPAALQAVQKAADNAEQQLALDGSKAGGSQDAQVEAEAEQTEVADQAPVVNTPPPPPPAINAGSSDKPTSVSPTS